MVCKKDVVTWFKSLKSYKRVDVMCSLLQLCVPFELRFLGTCLEDLAKRDYQDLRQTETVANNLSELNSPEVQCFNNQEARTKLALYVSLLHSCNDACSNKIYKILTKDDVNSVLNLAMTDDLVLEELLSIYTLVLNHPAFSFDQKIAIDKIFSKLQDEESRLCDQNFKIRQANFSHANVQENIHDKIQQPPLQSYQPCVEDVHQPCFAVTNAGPCPPLPPPHQHPHPAKPYLPYGGEMNDERRMGGAWGGGPIPCDNGAMLGRPTTLPGAPSLDPAGSPLLGARVSVMPPDPSGSPLIGGRMPSCDPSRVIPCDPSRVAPCDSSRVAICDPTRVGPCEPVRGAVGPPCEPPASSPLVSRNNSPCHSPSRPGTPPRHRQQPPPNHSPPPQSNRATNHKDQTKEVPVPNVPIEQLSRMNEEELREIGLPPNVIHQINTLKQVSNGLPPPPTYIDYRKKHEVCLLPKPDMMMRSMDGYPGGGGVCMGTAAMPCSLHCFPVAPRPKYGPVPPQVYPTLESLRVMRIDQESNSSASDTASDHSPPDTPGPQDPGPGRRVHNPPPPRRPNTTNAPHHNPLNQRVMYRRREGGGMVNGCEERKVYSGGESGGYYGAGHPPWPHQYMRPAYPAPHFPPFVPPQPRPPHPQPFHFNGEVVYPYPYQPFPPPPHLQAKVSCYNCGSPSHAPLDCPELTMEEMTYQGQYKMDYSKSGGQGGGSQQGGAGHMTTPTSPTGADLPPPNSDK